MHAKIAHLFFPTAAAWAEYLFQLGLSPAWGICRRGSWLFGLILCLESMNWSMVLPKGAEALFLESALPNAPH